MKTAAPMPTASGSASFAQKPFASTSFARKPWALLLFALCSFACAPQALAFPPCPSAPLDLVPIDGEGASMIDQGGEIDPWYLAHYAIVGDPNLIESNASESQDNPHTGKCGDRSAVPVLDANSSTGVIGATPIYAPTGTFGTIFLPDWGAATPKKRIVVYAFEFAIDDTPLPAGAWVDLLQLELRLDNRQLLPTEPLHPGTFYRLRKLSTHRLASALALIESRPSTDVDTPRTDRIVALLPLEDRSGATAMHLRWTQTASLDTPKRIDTTLEFLRDNGTPLYEAKLENQWADVLSMGLLDYNLSKLSLNAAPPQVVFSKMGLTAE